MKKVLIIAFVAVTVFSFAACKSGGIGNGKALIGKWYGDKEFTSPFIEFKAGGKCIWGFGGDLEYEVKGTTIKVIIPNTGSIFADFIDCKLEGKVITCTIAGSPVTLYMK